MEKNSRIYVAGHAGLVGSALTKYLRGKGYDNLILKTIDELDLTDQKAVEKFFEEYQPEYVFLAAAVVGGIMANNTYRADFIYNNLMIQNNVLHFSWKYKVKKLLFLGSTCIYPKDAQQPLKEEYLLTSPLEYTNEPYAIAKIAGLKMCESFNLQYGTDFISVMPTNLYGPGDNYNLEKSHVLPALLRKIHLGKCLESWDWHTITKDLNKNPIENIKGDSGKMEILSILKKYGVFFLDDAYYNDFSDAEDIGRNKGIKVAVNIWGSGIPLREFMYSEDMAEACVYIMENIDVKKIIKLGDQMKSADYHSPHFINIGTGEEITIRGLAVLIKELVGFNGEIISDLSKPDGTMRKTTDTSYLKRLGYNHKYDLRKGIAQVYRLYLEMIGKF
jgi:GDP-L-fucose synthase